MIIDASACGFLFGIFIHSYCIWCACLYILCDINLAAIFRKIIFLSMRLLPRINVIYDFICIDSNPNVDDNFSLCIFPLFRSPRSLTGLTQDKHRR